MNAFDFQNNKHIRRSLIVLAILAVGLFLRCLAISQQSLWFDEAFSVDLASKSVSDALGGELTNPPLHFLLLHYWIAVFGQSEAAVRMLSVIPSTLSIIIVWGIGLKLLSPRSAWLPVGFMTISSFQIYYAQEARCFTWLMFFLLVASYAMLMNFSEDKSKKQLWKGVYLVSATMALYTHYYAVFYISGQALFSLWYARRLPKEFFSWIAVYLLGAFLGTPLFIRMFQATSGGGQRRAHLFLKLPQTVFSLIYGDALVPMDAVAKHSIQSTLMQNWYWLLLGLLCVLVLGIYGILYYSKKNKYLSFLACVGIFPIAASFLVSFKIMLFDERYLIASSPFLFMLIAGSFPKLISATNPWFRNLGLVVLGFFILLLSIGTANYFFNPRFGKDQWREAARLVDNIATENDLVVFHASWMMSPFNYYSKRHDLNKHGITTGEELIPSSRWTEFVNQTKNFKRLIFVKSHCPTECVFEELGKHYKVVSHHRFPKANGIDVYIMEPNRTHGALQAK